MLWILATLCGVGVLIFLFSLLFTHSPVQKAVTIEKTVDAQSCTGPERRRTEPPLKPLKERNRLVKIASSHKPQGLRTPLAVRFNLQEHRKVITPGHLLYWSETGTEGGYWAFAKDGFKGSEGLHILRNCDWLTVFNPNGSVRWEGRIRLNSCAPFKQRAGGLRIHNDQMGVERQFWAEMFVSELKAELTVNACRRADDGPP
jgi:hypothetical protein